VSKKKEAEVHGDAAGHKIHEHVILVVVTDPDRQLVRKISMPRGRAGPERQTREFSKFDALA
jgi:hypothetical protein